MFIQEAPADPAELGQRLHHRRVGQLQFGGHGDCRQRIGDVVSARHREHNRRTLLVVQEERLNGSGEVDASIQYEDFRSIGEAALLCTVATPAVSVIP